MPESPRECTESRWEGGQLALNILIAGVLLSTAVAPLQVQDLPERGRPMDTPCSHGEHSYCITEEYLPARCIPSGNYTPFHTTEAWK